MKNIIVGTAGHIDHGKTTLIKAMTGKDTDRWEEEKKRGITIDLGFAYFDLPNKNRIGIIDVPGHEKFIKNMLAGVIGMDLVLLVIAADEGIMPQTEEHINILNLLGIKNGIVVLTKCDLVDKEWLELVKDDIKDELEDTFFKDSPMIEVSSVTRQGIDELINKIQELTSENLEERDITTIPRLPIDRVFSISGFGTVITGTLISGQIKKGDELEIYPVNKVCRVRNIQVHGIDMECCFAGQRAAINLSNIKKKELYRGCVLAPINSMKNTMMLDVKINLLKSSKRIIENRSRLHLYTGTSEVLCRIVLLDKELLSPGESCYAQLRLEEEIAVRRGDKFIVRFYSPMETVGGGEIIEPVPNKKKRFDNELIEILKIKEQGSHTDVIENIILENSKNIPTIGELAKITALSLEEMSENIKKLDEEGKITIFKLKKDRYIWHKRYERQIEDEICKFIGDYNVANPYKYGIKKSEIKSKFFLKLKQNVFDEIINNMINKNLISQFKDYLFLAEYIIKKDDKYNVLYKKIVNLINKSKLDFVRLSEILALDSDNISLEDILNLLLDTEEIVKVCEDTFTSSTIIENTKTCITEYLEKNGKITAGECRDILNTNRKSAISLLEYFDSIKFTKRIENDRILNKLN
ncbi:selenocysteine-specific translation elongation factor [Sedimentibacter sp. zth1]|uniref:selenocysteine-specific translation elongation factor n=1 Tax=Sedimentibacter sp. zth1 TaxID=2816908 RepID=UPI001A9163DC|nr:selenocysteine-specific translation elongation factor [Sedimentibacter sp. zth1]QSX06963.1 selenocysteine-specific translation elongation factor [Sedimentibacter sp. zth1]